MERDQASKFINDLAQAHGQPPVAATCSSLQSFPPAIKIDGKCHQGTAPAAERSCIPLALARSSIMNDKQVADFEHTCRSYNLAISPAGVGALPMSTPSRIRRARSAWCCGPVPSTLPTIDGLGVP